MRAWRLTKRRYARQLDGAGNRLTGARWNSPGRGLVYASLAPATCILETLVHFPPALRRRLPDDFVFVELALPATPGWLFRGASGAAASLPPDLAVEATRVLRGGPARYRRAGDEWLAGSGALFFLAPSAVVPLEWNVMLDPLHPRISDVEVAGIHPCRFDERLVAGF